MFELFNHKGTINGTLRKKMKIKFQQKKNLLKRKKKCIKTKKN